MEEQPSTWRLSNGHTPPQAFSEMRKFPCGCFSACFSCYVLTCPCVWSDRAPCECVLCWPLLPGAGHQGTLIRDRDSDQECHNHSLCRAAPMKVTACRRHLWGQCWPRFSSPINRRPRLTEKRIWLGWILFSIPRRGRQILFPFSFPACNLELVSVGNISGFAKSAAAVSRMSCCVTQTTRTRLFNLQTQT